MSRWLVVKDELGVLPTPFITGDHGTSAIEAVLPDHFIGKVYRIRQWETPDFILQKVKKIAGQTVTSGPRCGYKYHKPTITRIT